MERAIESSSEDTPVKAVLEGVELTLKTLLGAVEKFGISQIHPVGEDFDPGFHQAMAMQPSDEVPANKIIAVMQKGFALNGRLLRPAMVMVSKGDESKSVDTKA